MSAQLNVLRARFIDVLIHIVWNVNPTYTEILNEVGAMLCWVEPGNNGDYQGTMIRYCKMSDMWTNIIRHNAQGQRELNLCAELVPDFDELKRELAKACAAGRQ